MNLLCFPRTRWRNQESLFCSYSYLFHMKVKSLYTWSTQNENQLCFLSVNRVCSLSLNLSFTMISELLRFLFQIMMDGLTVIVQVSSWALKHYFNFWKLNYNMREVRWTMCVLQQENFIFRIPWIEATVSYHSVDIIS